MSICARTYGEKVDARFSADAFNFANHPNDPAPNPTTGLQDISQQSTAKTCACPLPGCAT